MPRVKSRFQGATCELERWVTKELLLYPFVPEFAKNDGGSRDKRGVEWTSVFHFDKWSIQDPAVK